MQVLRGEVKAGGVKRGFIGVYVMFIPRREGGGEAIQTESYVEQRHQNHSDPKGP